MARYVMAIDASKCMNCKACVVACQQRNSVPAGLSRNWVKETRESSFPSGWAYQPGACMHCDKPLCVEACPTHATFKDKDGVVQVNANQCIGCGSCIAACPYHARYRNPISGITEKCDYCAESRAHGLEPACVHICTTKARVFGDADDPNSAVSKALASNKHVYVVSPAVDTKPSLTYLGATTPTDWPSKAEVPAAIGIMGPLATGVRLLGGLSLFGCIAVFFKQLIWPSESKKDGEDHSDEA